jgi:hypothetical protein
MDVHFWQPGAGVGVRLCDGLPAIRTDGLAEAVEHWLEADEVTDDDAFDFGWISSTQPHSVTCAACLAHPLCAALLARTRPPEPASGLA